MKFMLVLGYLCSSYLLTPRNLHLESLDNCESSPELRELIVPPKHPLPMESGGMSWLPRHSPHLFTKHFKKDKFTGDLPQTLSFWFIQISIRGCWKTLWRQDRGASKPWTPEEFSWVHQDLLQRYDDLFSFAVTETPISRLAGAPPIYQVTFLGKRWMVLLQSCHVLKTLLRQ